MRYKKATLRHVVFLALADISGKEVQSRPPALPNHRLSWYICQSLFLLCKQQASEELFQHYVGGLVLSNTTLPDLIVRTETQQTPRSLSTVFFFLFFGLKRSRAD